MLVFGIEILCIFILAMIFSAAVIDERKKNIKNMRPIKMKGYWDGRERRNTDRLNIILEVKYYIDGKIAAIKSVDISAGGIRLLLDEKIERKTVLHLEMKLPNHEHIIKTTGEVVWSKESIEDEKGTAKRLFSTGVKFLKFHKDDEKEFFDFIHSLKP